MCLLVVAKHADYVDKVSQLCARNRPLLVKHRSSTGTKWSPYHDPQRHYKSDKFLSTSFSEYSCPDIILFKSIFEKFPDTYRICVSCETLPAYAPCPCRIFKYRCPMEKPLETHCGFSSARAE